MFGGEELYKTNLSTRKCSPIPNVKRTEAFAERQPRDQTPPCRNISTSRNFCLYICYDLSPVIYQELATSMPRRVAVVLRVKCDAMRY
ncbi:hypothetical protein TNCV_3347831 [Trichonephila clavipes]|nr:hypothetical protein TNCV_3347831 [Trichonephila clavipes]